MARCGAVYPRSELRDTSVAPMGQAQLARVVELLQFEKKLYSFQLKINVDDFISSKFIKSVY
jgi:hypothetical protein